MFINFVIIESRVAKIKDAAIAAILALFIMAGFNK